eukprot:g23186.t2
MNQLTGTQARLPALLEASEQRAQQELRRESQVAELRKELIHLRQDFVQFTTDGSEAPGSMDEKFHSRLSAMQDTLMTLIEKEAKEKNQAVDALPEVCRALRAEAITMLQEVSRPSLRAVWHNLQRWLLDPIREPKARHILRTPLTRCVRDGLEPLALLAAELGLRPSARCNATCDAGTTGQAGGAELYHKSAGRTSSAATQRHLTNAVVATHYHLLGCFARH